MDVMIIVPGFYSCPNKPYVVYIMQMEEGNVAELKSGLRLKLDIMKMVRLRRSVLIFFSSYFTVNSLILRFVPSRPWAEGGSGSKCSSVSFSSK